MENQILSSTMTDENPPTDIVSKDEPINQSQNTATVTINITPFHAPILEGWSPTASHSYNPPAQPAPVLAATSSPALPTAIAKATNPTQENPRDVEMTDINSCGDVNLTTTCIDADLISTTPLSEAESKYAKAITETATVAIEENGSDNNTFLNPTISADPSVPAIIGKLPNSISSRTTALDNSNNDTTNTTRVSSSQNIDMTGITTDQVMPKEAPLHGAPTRQYLNENITGVLLEGMKMIVKERPSNPLKALGEYLIHRSIEINQK